MDLSQQASDFIRSYWVYLAGGTVGGVLIIWLVIAAAHWGQHTEARERVVAAIANTIVSGKSLEGLPAELATLSQRGGVPHDQRLWLVHHSWVRALDLCLAEGVLTDDAEKRLMRARDVLQVPQ